MFNTFTEMRTILLIIILNVLIFCQTPQERARLNAFQSVCPNFGFIAHSDIPNDSIYTDEKFKSTYVSVRYKDSNGNYVSEDYEISRLIGAADILSKADFDFFSETYSKVCGKSESPNKGKIKYIIKLNEDIEKERNTVLFKTVPIDKILDIREKDKIQEFEDSWYNRFVSPSENNSYKGSQFEYERKKQDMEKLRKYKFLVAYNKYSPELDDYDFKKKCFEVDEIKTTIPSVYVDLPMKDPRALHGESRFELHADHEFEKTFCIPLEQDKAEKFKTDVKKDKYQWSFLLEIKKVIDAPSNTKCKNYTNMYVQLACREGKWEKIKLRRFLLKPIAYRAKSKESDEIFEGKL